MSILSRLRGIDRRHWHVCYNCMMMTGHDTANSVFYSEGPPAMVLGRPLMICPRCGNNNTKSFQTLKDEGSEAPLWGLERVVRQHPRSQFVVKPGAQAAGASKQAPSGNGNSGNTIQ